jgi:1-acyl-sn-glycerol-3-phosphate acyltransferase
MCGRTSEPVDGRGFAAKRCSRPGSLRHILVELAGAFDAGGVAALNETHLGCLKRSWRYRALYRLLRLFLPITPLLTITEDLDRLVGELGVDEASRVTLARPPVPWAAEMPPDGEREIRSASIIVYGTHGSIITPLLLAAAIGRPDLKMIAASYIAKLGPNIAGCSFPVYAAAPVTVKRAGRKGLVPRAMGWIAWKSEGGLTRDAARERNREALRGGAAHVRQGGGLLIAPEGRNHREPWRPGIGAIVAGLAQDSSGKSIYLVPWSIRGASITGIFQLLSRNPFVRRLGRLRFRHPVRVALGEPMPIARVVAEAGCDPLKITAYLERDYRGRGF